MEETRYNFDYLRLSKEDGDDDGNSTESQSIGSQRMCVREFKLTHNLTEPFEEVIDDGYSGTHFERPGIKKILKLVELGKVKTIIVRDLSRFARNYLEAGYYLEYVFPAFDVRFISINDGYDSADYADASAGLHIAIKNLINQMYSRDISIKIKSAVDLKKMNGEFVYGTAPYGYKKGSVKNTIVIDDEAALVVRRIFNLACQGTTVTQIAQLLNGEGVPTPSMYLSSVRSKNYIPRTIWTFESVRNIVKNRIYTGDTEPFKSHVVKLGSDRVKMIPPEERLVLENTHEAIVSRETYFKAQQIFRTTKKKSPRQGSTSVLNSFLVCGCCGNRLIKGKAQNKTFLCGTARYVLDSECKQIRVSEAKMKEILLRAIHQQCMMMDSHIKATRAAAKQSDSEIDKMRRKLKFQRRSHEGIQSAKMELYEQYVAGNFDKEEYLRRKLELNEKEERISAEVAITENVLSELTEKVPATEVLATEEELIAKYSAITELDADLLRELIKSVTVYPDASINIVWNFKNLFENNTISAM